MGENKVVIGCSALKMTAAEATKNLRNIIEPWLKLPEGKQQAERRRVMEKRVESALLWAKGQTSLPPLYGGCQKSVEVGEALDMRRAQGNRGPLPEVCLSDWESKNLAAQWLLREGEPVPPVLAAFTADVLADVLDPIGATKREPYHRRRGRKDEGGLQFTVVDMIACCVSFGLPPVRSTGAHIRVCRLYQRPGNAYKAGGSGSDIVGLAMGLSYWNCRKIWRNRNNNRLPYRTQNTQFPRK